MLDTEGYSELKSAEPQIERSFPFLDQQGQKSCEWRDQVSAKATLLFF